MILLWNYIRGEKCGTVSRSIRQNKNYKIWTSNDQIYVNYYSKTLLLYCGKKELAMKILILEDGKYNVVVNGHYRRNQLVVSLFNVRNSDHITRLIGFQWKYI